MIMKNIIKILLLIFMISSCTSYVPTTEKKGKKIIRKLDIRNKANDQRIKAIANTYGLATMTPTMVRGDFMLPEVKIDAPVNLHIQKNSSAYDSLISRYDQLMNRYNTALNQENKKALYDQINHLKERIRELTYARQDFTYEDDTLKADFGLDPASDLPFTFAYILKPRPVPVSIPHEDVVIDAGREYYQFWQFWAVMVLWIGTAGFFIYTVQMAHK